MCHKRQLRRAALMLLLAAASIPAALQGNQARADSDTASVAVTVTVVGALTLTFIDNAINLSGAPGDTSEDLDTVSFTVTTNNATGYNITVDPDVDVLAGAAPAGGSIPVTNLAVRDQSAGSTTPDYVNLTLDALTIHNQATPSAVAGDAITNDYRILIPAGTAPNTYTGTLTYVATDNGP